MPDIWSLIKTSDNKNIFYKLRYNILQISKETEAITQTWDASLCLLKITYTIVDKAKTVSLGLVGLQSNCACRHKNVKCQFLLQSCCTCHLSAAHHLVTKYKALFSLSGILQLSVTGRDKTVPARQCWLLSGVRGYLCPTTLTRS